MVWQVFDDDGDDMQGMKTLVVPAVTLAVILLLFAARPSMTGMAVYGNGGYDAEARLMTDESAILPENSTVVVSADGASVKMSARSFIERSGAGFEYVEGYSPELNYTGFGYTGNHSYSLSLKDLGLNVTDDGKGHKISIKIFYGDLLISENEMETGP